MPSVSERLGIAHGGNHGRRADRPDAGDTAQALTRRTLNRCVLASRQAHPNERPRDALARLMVEVPACMNVAGYEQVVTNMSCSRTAWQGDVFCYVPKSYLGKLIYRLDAARVARLQFEAVPRSKAGGV